MSRTVLLSIAIMSLGMIFVPLGDSAGKAMVTAGVHPIFVTWARFLVGALLFLPFIRPATLAKPLANWRIWVRGTLQVATIVCILTALKTEPLANVFGAFFVGPIVSFALSTWLLKEPITWARTALLFIGFVGVLLVVQPTAQMSAGLLWAVLAGTCYGAFLTASRWLSTTATARTLLMSQLVIGSLVLLPFAIPAVPVIDTPTAALLLASGLASVIANLALVIAYGGAPASTLAPFVYVQLISATFFGWAIFGDLPNATAAFGLALLIASGLATLALKPR